MKLCLCGAPMEAVLELVDRMNPTLVRWRSSTYDPMPYFFKSDTKQRRRWWCPWCSISFQRSRTEAVMSSERLLWEALREAQLEPLSAVLDAPVEAEGIEP